MFHLRKEDLRLHRILLGVLADLGWRVLICSTCHARNYCFPALLSGGKCILVQLYGGSAWPRLPECIRSHYSLLWRWGDDCAPIRGKFTYITAVMSLCLCYGQLAQEVSNGLTDFALCALGYG